MLLPDRLRSVWQDTESGQLTKEAAFAEQERQLDAYRAEWSNALIRKDEPNLRTSLLREVAAYYGIDDLNEVERLCADAVGAMRQEWERRVDSSQRASIEGFYQSATMIYDLMGWHSLQ